jgi:dienelactone hydrolase
MHARISIAWMMLIAPVLLAAPTTRPVAPYPVDHDAPLEASDRVETETDDYTLHRVEFNGIRKGSRVPAYMYIPKKADYRAPYPAVLLQYGTGGNKTTNYIVMIAQIAVKKGLAVLTIDAPNRGERKGKDTRIGFLDANFLQYLGDYSRATDFLTTRKEVDKNRLGYVGISWGAITGVTYTAHDERIKVIASLVGGGNFAGLIPGAVPEEVRKETEAYDPFYHVALIGPRPLLLMNVTKDQLVPRFMSESLHKNAPESAKKIWLEADHFFNGVDRYKTCDEVIDFVIQNMPKSEK